MPVPQVTTVAEVVLGQANPLEHTVHDVCIPTEYEPDGQVRIVSEVVNGQAKPGGHDVHCNCPPIEKLPGEHTEFGIEASAVGHW